MFVDLDDLYLSNELKTVRRSIRRYVEEKIMPNGDVWEEQGFIPRVIFREMGELGFLSMSFPERVGGSELGALSSLILSEELGRSTYGGVMASISVHSDMSASHLARHGNAALIEQYMPSIINGSKVCAVAVTEPGAGSDVARLKTKAEKIGDKWVINGSKMFITNGVHGDLFMVAARTDPNAKGSRGISLFVVEKGTPGFTSSEPLKKTGWLSSDTAQLFFDDVEVPETHLIGEVNKGFYYVMEGFQLERICIGGQVVGQCEKAIALTLEWLTQRQAFGGTLWDMDNIRTEMAALLSELTAAKHLAYHTAYLDANKQDAAMQASMVKSYLPELLNKVLYKCVQFHGGMGYMRETPVERMARDARILPIGGGATEVMLKEVAKRMI